MTKQREFKIKSLEEQEDAIGFLDDMIYEFNALATNQNDGERFTKVIRDENENIIAGISGWTWASVSEITLLWVKEEYRKKGLGKKLLKAAEDEIIKKGCTLILLRSYSFQAPLFYEKNGYKTVYVLDDFPKGFTHSTLVKKIFTTAPKHSS